MPLSTMRIFFLEKSLVRTWQVLLPLRPVAELAWGEIRAMGWHPDYAYLFYLLNVEIDFIQLIRAGNSFCFLFAGKHEVTVLS
jgi:hypothetical protein